MSIFGSIFFPLHIYSIKVVDSDTGNPISGAQCIVKKNINNNTIIGKGTTNSKGIYTFSSISYSHGTVYISVSKNGYITGGMLISRNDTVGQLRLVHDTVFSSYTITVKDDSGYSISDATIDVFSNTSSEEKINDNNLSIDETSKGKYTVRYIDSNRLYFEISKNGYEKSERFYVDPSQTKDITLKKENIKDYYYNVCVQNNIERIGGVKIKFYKDFLYTKEYDSETYTTSESDGLVSLHAGKLSKCPSPIYAKYLNNDLPEGITSTDNDRGAVVASESPITPTLTLKVKNEEIPIIYHYDIEVINEFTEQPLKSIAVKYVYNGSTLSSQVTDDKGVCKFSCIYPEDVHIIIEESEYSEVDVTYQGIDQFENDTIVTISLKPKNSVKVVDLNNKPVPNIKLQVIKYEDDKAIVLGTYITYENGYIDTIDSSLYTSDLVVNEEVLEQKYIVVASDGYSDGYQDRIKHILTKGHFVITLPEKSNVSNELESDNSRFNELSIYNIKKNISVGNLQIQDSGSSELVKYPIDSTENEDSKDFRMNIVDPDSVNVYDIFSCVPVSVDNNKNVIGSVDISLKSDVNELKLKIINRYSGYYNPIFKDVIFYDNFKESDDDKEWPYSNTKFDYKYTDNYGKFGVINNMWFHKANPDKNCEIINTLKPVYPLTGQTALDYKDYNIFSSSWDMDYYTKQKNLEESETCKNIASMKEKLCMFGSKYLNVPESIEICGLSIGDDTTWNGEWDDNWITNPSGCPGEVMFKEINDNNVNFYVFLKKRIVRYFQDKLRSEFEKYIGSQNPNYSFGKEGIDDDIEEYVTKNILKLYKLEKVRFFVRRTKIGQHNSKIENDYVSHLGDTVSELKQQGFDEIRNVHMSKMNRDDFDRKLVYNLVTGMKEEFGFAFILKDIKK